MQAEPPRNVYTVEDICAAYNMGLDWAIMILEEAAEVKPEGRRHLIEELKRNIAQSKTRELPPTLWALISTNNS